MLLLSLSLLRQNPYQHPTIVYHDSKKADLTWYSHKPVRDDYFITHFAWILKQGVHDPKLVDFLLNLFRWQADENKREFRTINWRQIF